MSKKKFKAESQRLLDLMINSIYTHKEIFLREIISNASDAVDKLCFKALTDSEVGMSRSDFGINIKRDILNRTLTVSDNGIGMTKEEMESNLGTIAKSGSFDFKQEMGLNRPEQKPEDAQNIEIIGQFGVGFYSAFMVSDKVTVASRAYGSEDAWVWESSGADGYTLNPCDKDTPGTDIIMHIKEDTEDENYSQYLDEYTIVSMVRKYSDYIRYPIVMELEKRRPVEDGDEKKMETYTVEETLNSMVPIWQRLKSELTEEDYNNFYKDKFMDYQDPLKAIHVNAEGLVSYKALLYIPATVAYDYYSKDYKKGLQLYSNGVMIMDACSDLLPEYFRFVRGVVDSPDLSLNISRELLQHDRQLKLIAGNIEKKVRNELLDLLTNQREKYEEFFENYGLQLKHGVVAEFGAHKENLQDLLLFYSSQGKMVTLKEYVEGMKEDQKDIYYATGDSIQLIESLPQAEVVLEKGYEILYFSSEIDEFVPQAMMTYREKIFKSVNRDDLGLETAEEKEQVEKQAEENKGLLEFVKNTLDSEIKEVKISHKLRNQPVCLSASGPISFEMEKYFNLVQPEAGARAERVLELNANHPLFAKLLQLQDTDPEKAKNYTWVLYQQAKLMAGLDIDDPAVYSELIFSLI